MNPSTKGEVEVFEYDPFKEGSATADGKRKRAAPKERKQRDDNTDLIDNNLNPKQAFQTFAGTVYIGNERDPLRSISSQRSEFSHEPLVASKRKLEAPLDRYNRLKAEVSEFEKELLELQKQQEQSQHKVGPVDLGTLVVDDLQTLGRQLDQLQQSHQNFLSSPSASSSTTAETDSAELIRRIKALQTINTDKKKASTSEETSSDEGLKYEVYLSHLTGGNSTSSQRQTQDIRALDQRLASLEKTIGAPTGDNPYQSLHLGLVDLHQKLLLLDDASIEGIGRRLETLTTRLDQLQQSRERLKKDSSASQIGTSEKVEQVWSRMEKWDSAAQNLPLILQRLQSLRYIHEEAADATIRLRKLEDSIGASDKLVEDDRVALGQLQTAMQANAQRMEANITALQKRLDAVSEAVKQR